MKKIIDCFTFYKEMDMLYYRLSILYDIVDYFVIVEARQTFVGIDKVLYFEENKERYAQFLDKIIHVVVELPFKHPNIDFHLSQQWINEIYQRDCISFGIDKIPDLQDDDIIIITDVDEIPDKNTLHFIKSNTINIKYKICYLKMIIYFSNFTIKSKSNWIHSKLLDYFSYKYYIRTGLSCDKIRMIHCSVHPPFYNGIIIEKGGWHISGFGDINFLLDKVTMLSHQENNTPEKNNYEYMLKSITDEKMIDELGCFRVSIESENYLPYDYDNDKYFFNELMKLHQNYLSTTTSQKIDSQPL